MSVLPVVLALAAVAALGALIALSAAPAAAQPADAAWRTLVVGDGAFRVHYPAAAEAWARQTAARLVVIRERLAEEIGYRPDQTIDVVVTDPLSRPNGSAWALLAAPRMVLWTSPPEPTSILGAYRDWGELVATHEEAHLVHLLRPSRRPWRSLAARLLPLGGPGPIGLRAPRWVTEGYATLLEGRLTGSGRPNSDLVAAVLRQRAVAGRLPSYGALGSDDRTWLGRSMAYLAGSAYLAWLEERSGPQSLRDLWARMSARQNRSFDDAFRGVFGDLPAALYGRFTAELTWQAVEVRHALQETSRPARTEPGTETGGSPRTGSGRRPAEGIADDGTLWLKRGWRTGAPAVSPDGDRLAVVLRERDAPPRLAVFSTADDPEAARAREEAVERLLARDPEDVPAVPPEAPPRTPLAELPTFHGRAPAEPRWLADGRSLLYIAPGPDTAGFIHFDLYRWTPDLPASTAAADPPPAVLPAQLPAKAVRITRQADLRSPDPAPAATPGVPGGSAWAVAVRNRHGASQLVRVDLGSGEVTALTEPSVETVWATPRIAPDGRRLAVVRNRDGRWELVVFAFTREAGGLRELTVLPTPGALVADPAWSSDGRTLFAAAGADGFVDLVAFDVGEASPGEPAPAQTPAPIPIRSLTRSGAAALAPAPTPDGRSLFFLGLTDSGLDVRRLALEPATGVPAEPHLGGGPGGGAGLDPEPGTESGPVPPAGAADRPVPPLGASAAADYDALPPAVPYRFGPRERSPLVGLALTPAGSAFEAGVAGTDPVGRLDWIAVGAISSGGAPNGAAVGATFRGLPIEMSFHLFTADLAPSEQGEQGHGAGRAPVATAGDLDVTRRGLAAERRWERRYAPFSVRLGFGLVAGQVAGPAESGVPAGDDATATDTFGTAWSRLDGGLLLTPSRGRWQGLLGLGARFEQGETDGAFWSRHRTALATGLFRDGKGGRLTWVRRGSDNLSFAFDRYQVGGVRRSVLPAIADATRVEVPALEEGTLVGDTVESQRAELLGLGGLLPGPVPDDTRLFFERHRAWNQGTARSDWLTLAGVELTRTLDPVPLLGLPGAHVTAGAAYLMDTPGGADDGDVRLWAALSWSP